MTAKMRGAGGKAAMLHPTTISDYPTIQNMVPLYVYDASRECGFVISENGSYEPIDYRIYFEDPNRRAFLIKVGEELAGFTLLNQGGTLPETEWKIDQFFILRKFQLKGIGRQIAQELWHDYPAFWEVSSLPENKRAIAFWRKTIGDFTGDQYAEEIREWDEETDQSTRLIFSFDSRPSTPSHKDSTYAPF